MSIESMYGDSVYGYCPQANCGAPGISRTRGIPTWDTCARGHRYLASMALKSKVKVNTFQSYVCGFMFDHDRSMVVLVQKDRPKWQAGFLNGVGGKIEVGEVVHEAMSREFLEETGVATQPIDWGEFATLRGPDFTVHMMRIFSDDWAKVRTMETEVIATYPVKSIMAGSYACVRNLAFLIPLALDRGGIQFPVVFNNDQPDEAKAA